MADSDMSDPRKIVPAWRARLHIDPVVALLTAIVIAITIYFAFRPTESKQMTLTSNGLRPLININAQNPGDFKILYRGKEVASPWIFSGSLTNTGNTPIDASDVENNKMLIIFPNVAVLRPVITSVQPKDIIASIDAAGDTVELSHKLMNPGDTISFDVILSGEPGPREVRYHVRGMSRLIERENAPPPTAGVFGTTKSAQGIDIGEILLASILPATFLLLFVSFDIIPTQVFWERTVQKEITKLQNMKEFERDPLASNDPVSSILMSAIPPTYNVEMINDPVVLTNIVGRIPNQLLDLYHTNGEEAKNCIHRIAKASFKTVVSRAIYLELPRPVDRVARDRINALPFTEPSTSQFIHTVSATLISIPRKLRTMWFPVGVAGMTFVVVAVFSIIRFVMR
jgi:hypothetical protein